MAQARLTSLILLDESYSGIFLQDLTVYLGPDYLTPSSFSSAASPSAIGAAWPRSLAARNESALVHDKFVEIARHLSWKVTRSFLRKRLPPKGALKPITSGSAYFEIRVVLSQLAERNLRESV